MLTVLATAFPFLFPYTAPPSTNFWPLMMAWLCGWGIFAVGGIRSQCARGKTAAPSTAPDVRVELVPLLAVGLLLAALLASAIGLLQYFDAAAGWEPWIHASRPGQAMGNLRQRNQQATLLSMGVWALLWTVAQTQLYVQAQAEGRAAPGVGMALHGGGRPWPLWLVGMLTAWALALLAVGSAATASRTGLAQWLVVVVLLWAWRVSVGRLALGLALAGLAMYAAAAWLLPDLLLQWTGFRAEGLFARFGDAPGCTSRRVLWSNVLYLIAQKPWLGWGWGELDFAHYST
ncbi:MAG: pilin glycosylation ligase domain-containing protein, partial [Burkholderiaceae bacterium]|nr:pilin glycosylation ligase domain-containing protein [Burkholderiaceae bacterium]